MDEFSWAVKQARKWAKKRKAQIWRLERLPDGYWEVRTIETSTGFDGTVYEVWMSHCLGPVEIGLRH
jgi:hypothetical protein